MFHADAESHNLVVATFQALDADHSGDITQADFGKSKGAQVRNAPVVSCAAAVSHIFSRR